MGRALSVKKRSVVKDVKLLSCVFFNDVLCSYRKDERFTIMNRCLKCAEYERFEQQMDEEDERIMNEIDRERAMLDEK
jgi:hypothetical protein